MDHPPPAFSCLSGPARKGICQGSPKESQPCPEGSLPRTCTPKGSCLWASQKDEGKPKSRAKGLTAKGTNVVVVLLLLVEASKGPLAPYTETPNRCLCQSWWLSGTASELHHCFKMSPALQGGHRQPVCSEPGDPRSPQSGLQCLRGLCTPSGGCCCPFLPPRRPVAPFLVMTVVMEPLELTAHLGMMEEVW